VHSHVHHSSLSIFLSLYMCCLFYQIIVVRLPPAVTCTGGGQNNGNTKKLRNRICVGYIERTSVGNTECSYICLLSVVLMSVH
jgi:hypothetical protein